MQIKVKNGYTKEIAEKYINDDVEVICVSTETKAVRKFDQENKKYTDEITGYSAYFVIADEEPFKIKFEKRQELKFLEACTFENLQAIEIGRNVYFKADKVVF